MKHIVDIDAAKSLKSKDTAAVHKHRFVADNMGQPWNKEFPLKDQKQKGWHLYQQKEEGEINQRNKQNPKKLCKYNEVIIEKPSKNRKLFIVKSKINNQ